MGNLLSLIGWNIHTPLLDCNDPTLAWETLKHTTPVIELKTDPPSEPWSEDKIRFVHISDTHSLTSHIESIPEGDVLLHTGDFTMRGGEQEVIDFNEWLGTLPHKHKIVIAGNHELTFDPNFVREKGESDKMKALLTNCIYLEDSSITVYGVKIYGSPYQPKFGNYAFPLERGQEALEKWNAIPNDVDILMTHGPPLGFGDIAKRKGTQTVRCGCMHLLQTIRERVLPKYHLYGHIHEDYGVRTDGQTVFVNAAYAGDHHGPSDKKPIVFDMPLPEGQVKDF